MAMRFTSGGSLLNRDFLLLALGNFFFFFNIHSFLLLPLYIKELGGGEFHIGIIMGTMSITNVAMVPFVGDLIDRFGRKRFLLMGSFIAFLIPLSFYFTRELSPLFILLRVLQGVGFSLAFTSSAVLVFDSAPPARMGQAIGVFGITGLSTQTLAPALGEFTMARGGFPALFLVATGFGISALLVYGLVRESQAIINPQYRRNLSDLFRKREFRYIVATAIIFGGASSAIMAFLPTYVRLYGLGRVSAFFLGYTSAAIGVRLLGGNLSDRLGRRKIILPTLLLSSLSIYWLALSHTPWFIPIVGILYGGSHGLLYPSLNALAVESTERENRGKATALFSASFNAGMAVSSFAFGWIAEVLGYRPMFSIAGILGVSGFLVFLSGGRTLGGRRDANRD
ncbi:MAG: MFS transporter [bacterium]